MSSLRAVAYCRYSSEGQRDGYSIEAQLNAIKTFCEREGIELVDQYIDEARSGTNDNRESFQRLIADSSKREWDYVIVHKLDRFARDRYDSAIYKKILKDNGVKLLSVLERLDDSPESVIMEGLLEAMAEYYSKNLSRETLKGKNEAAKDCRWLGGQHKPWGYTIDENKHLVIVPDEAIIIKEAFERIAGGETAGHVARDLNARGFRTRTGKPFSGSSLIRCFTNPVYKGTYSFGLRSRNKSKDPFLVPGGCPAIVSPELYDAVMTVHKQHSEEYQLHRKKAAAREKGDLYLLTGYIYCGECGSHYFGHSKKETGHNRKGERCYTYIYKKYRCARHTNDKRKAAMGDSSYQCKNKMIDKDALENYTIRLIEECVFSDETMHVIVKSLEEILSKKKESIADIKSVKKEISTLEKKEDRLLDLYLSGSISKDKYDERSASIRASLVSLRVELRRLEASSVPSFTPDKIKSTLLEVLNKNKESEDYKVHLISTFLDKIMVYPDRLEFYFKLPIFHGSYKSSASRDDVLVCKSTTVSTCVTLHTIVSMSDFLSGRFAYSSLSVSLLV